MGSVPNGMKLTPKSCVDKDLPNAPSCGEDRGRLLRIGVTGRLSSFACCDIGGYQ